MEVQLTQDVLDFILSACRSIHPREFIGFLRMEDDVVTEVVLPPKATYGEGFAQAFLHLMPVDRSIVGSVHSHPGESAKPSAGDLRFFGRRGDVHLIVKYPYENKKDIAAYDRRGDRMDRGVVTIDG